MTRALLGMILLVVAAAGCGDAAQDAGQTTTTTVNDTTTTTVDDTTTTTTPTTTTAGATRNCTNPEAGYSVEYPSDWATNSGETTPRCSYFHPRPFEVPPATEVFDLAVAISVQPVALETVSEQYGPDELEETTIADRQAVRVESVSTGEALLPEGIESYLYAVDLDGETLVAVTYNVDDLDYEHNKDVLDRMMETLELNSTT